MDVQLQAAGKLVSVTLAPITKVRQCVGPTASQVLPLRSGTNVVSMQQRYEPKVLEAAGQKYRLAKLILCALSVIPTALGLYRSSGGPVIPWRRM